MKLVKDSQGLLSFGGQQVTVRPCFPWLGRREHLSFVDEKGKEVFYVNGLDELDHASSSLLEEYLKEVEENVNIEKLIAIDEEVELRKYTVETNFGERIFYTKLDDWPYVNVKGEIIIQDLHGDIFYIKSAGCLCGKSRSLLSPYID